MAVKDKLVSFWEFEETSGTRTDSHGTNDLTDNNTVGYVSGVVGNAADFTEANQEWLSITDASQTGLEGGGDFTCGVWYNTDNANNAAIMGKEGSSGDFGWFIQVRSNGAIRMSTSGNGTSASVDTTSATPISSNSTDYLIIVQYDQSAGTADVYVDNTFIEQLTGLSTSIYDNSADFQIGRQGGGGFHNGSLDQAFFANDLLTSDERAELWNSGSGTSYAALSGGASRRVFIVS